MIAGEELSPHVLPDSELSALTEQVNAYASQVSLDFEELAWLRSVGKQLDCCRVDSSVEAVAAEVLPSLCDVIGAEALLLLYADNPDPSRGMDAYRSARFGDRAVDDAACRQVIESLRERAEKRPVVINGMGRGDVPERIAGISSLLLVSLSRHGARFGWLMALEKRALGFGQSPRQLIGEDEFGTIEAGMLGAAATLLSTHARNVQLFREKERLLVEAVRALINVIEAKDRYTCGHSDRVAAFSRLIAREMKLSPHQCEEIYMTGLLHDIGKIGVPDEVLRKPGRLTDEEFEQIKKHPEIGFNILKDLTPLAYALPGVLHHHEAIDGSGYPHGLKGDAIPLSARILAVADSYDAMTSDRPYRNGMPTEKAEAILRDGADRQWDRAALNAFFAAVADHRAIAAESKHRLASPLSAGAPAESESMRASIASAIAETHA